MKLTTTVTHDITFHVAYYEATEGGMDHDTYGSPVGDISAAVRLLELAKIQDPKMDWVIVAEVSTHTGGKQL